MYAQCPQCLTVFKLDAATVAQASGTVACGNCGATFDSLATLAEELPAELTDNLPLHASSPAPPILLMKVVREAPAQKSLFEPVTANPVAPPLVDPSAVPSFAQWDTTGRGTPHTGRWLLGCVVLVLALGAQLAWARRDTLTASPTTGPMLRTACGWLGCTLPAVSDPGRLQLLSRDVRPHPSVPNALLISMALRNNAPFRQPYPVVSITLSDLGDNRVAMRRFTPAEYVSDDAVRTAGLAPGAKVAMVFEVHDPGKNAVAFNFGFE